MKAIRKFTVRTVLPAALGDLDQLARNLRSSWHEPTRKLFADIDGDIWQQVNHDPVALLGELNPQVLEDLARDSEFVQRVREEASDLNDYLSGPRWYQQQQETNPDLPASIAYFSPEFGITASLPQYSGGLGILAGDHLKSASDLGVPLIGVGLLYGAGYFSQSLTRDGWQAETYPVHDPDGLPLTLLREADGTASLISINLPGGRTLHAQVWRADVGRVPLLLMDTDVHANDDQLRNITDRLYGGGGEHRLHQELLLGVGGVRALRLWERLSGTPAPEVFHTNEGHAGFLGIERIGELTAQGLTFAEGLEASRAGTVFTTHTPVPAGIDRFPMDLVRQYFDNGAVPGINSDDVLALGAENYDGGDPTVFNMAVMGLRLAQRANGVSTLHGEVSRGMFSGLWPGFDAHEVPITSVTNGVHAPTWQDPRITQLAASHLQHSELHGDTGWDNPNLVTDTQLWATLRDMREQLVFDVRERVRRSWLQRGASPAELGWVDEVLDPDVLTIGFARRVPTYKRLTLMLREPERLKAALLHPTHPVQLIVAGKSHPADEQGKRLIQELVRFADDPEVRHRIVFLPDYDIAMAQLLYPGCDVWLNNPLRPLEACGTSGMKAALNGALNLSILDGWWNEWAEDGHNGWVIPSANGVDDPEHRDDLEAAALYNLIDQHVAPTFYRLNGVGLTGKDAGDFAGNDQTPVPSRWLEMVRHALDSLGPKVQATRMVAEYVERLYLPAAISSRSLAAHGQAGARGLARWKHHINEAWGEVRVDHVESSGIADSVELGDELSVSVYVSLGHVSPEDVQVQLLSGRADDSDEIVDPHSTLLDHVETYEDGRHHYAVRLSLQVTGPFGYTVRIVPSHEGLASVAEVGAIAWA